MKKHTHQKAIYGNSERSNRQGSKFLRRRWQGLKQMVKEHGLEFNLEEDIMASHTRTSRLL